jgi:hypothetical protein
MEMIERLGGDAPPALRRVTQEGVEAALVERIVRERLSTEAAQVGSRGAESLEDLLNWLALDRLLALGYREYQPGTPAGEVLQRLATGRD